MKYFKKLNKDLTSPYQSYQYQLGKELVVDDFDDSNEECSSGFYYLKPEQLLFCPNTPIFEVKIGGQVKEFSDKCRSEMGTIVREWSKDEVVRYLEELDINKKVGFNFIEALYPFNPLFGEPIKPNKKDIANLKDIIRVNASFGNSVWASVRASVRDSVRASVWDSVRASVGDSVWASVGDSVWDSVRASVGDSVGAYTGSLFTNIKKWEYIDHKDGEYPFQSTVDLWYRGFVPSFDGKTWRLHSGENAVVVYEMERE